jgi:hypothetical protein
MKIGLSQLPKQPAELHVLRSTGSGKGAKLADMSSDQILRAVREKIPALRKQSVKTQKVEGGKVELTTVNSPRPLSKVSSVWRGRCLNQHPQEKTTRERD